MDEDFRELFGESVIVPDQVHVEKFANAHIDELKELLNTVGNPKTNKLVHQLMPNRLRRRAMSLNPRRLPRRFREMHMAQMAKSGTPRKGKRPSRKYRRKPSNLLKEYARRMKNFTWLETHIWHAKRFHMRELWGYKIPYAPCDRARRAAYRSISKHCMAQDVSFEGCIEVVGPEQMLMTGFARLSGKNCGLTMNAKGFMSGKREGVVTLFTADSFPLKSLGKVRVMWKPVEDENSRTVWIWAHPTFYIELVKQFILIFDLKNSNHDVEMTEHTDDRINFITKNRANIRIPHYSNGTVKVRELKDTINRFRLTGPLSHSVLQNAIQLAQPCHWLENWSQKHTETFRSHAKFWKKTTLVTSPAELEPGIVVSLNICDPRVIREKKRKKAIPPLNPELIDCAPDLKGSPESAIWDQKLRNQITESMITSNEINQKRFKEGTLPGMKGSFEDELQPVPILLIQRPGHETPKTGFGCGWDVIIPSGYGVFLWYNFFQSGARPGGIRETETLCHESGFSLHHPDTVSAKKENARESLEHTFKYFKMPDNKRCNYTKLAIASPFNFPWQQLVQEWNQGGAKEFFVLRDKDTLVRLDKVCQRKFTNCSAPQNSLVQVRLTAVRAGSFDKFAIICLPTRADLKQNVRNIRLGDNNPPYIEPLRADPNEVSRKKCRVEHKKLLKRLRNRRVRIKRRKQSISTTRVRIDEPQTATICSEQFRKMAKLWIPDAQTVRRQCSRETIGYVMSASFTMSEGKMTATGFVAAQGLQRLLEVVNKGKMLCLVRNPTSRNYRFAYLSIQIQE